VGHCYVQVAAGDPEVTHGCRPDLTIGRLSVNLARPLKEGQSDAISSQGQDITANL